MKRVYDMSTGQVLECPAAAEHVHELDFDTTALQLRLLPVPTESSPRRGIPPELVLADPNAFLDKMS